MNVSSIFESAKNDNTIKFDVQEVLRHVNLNHSYLENKSIDTCLKENINILTTLPFITEEKIQEITPKLQNYHFIDEVFQLHHGKYIRWIMKTDKNVNLKCGGVIIDIKFLDCVHVLIFNKYVGKNPIQIKFDDALIFQKITDEELLILFAQGSKET
jgi:hypothetical protein